MFVFYDWPFPLLYFAYIIFPFNSWLSFVSATVSSVVGLQICTGKCEQTSACARCALSLSPDLCVANCTFGVQLVASVQGRAVLTNGHTGHVPMAPGFFFFSRGPQLAVVK